MEARALVLLVALLSAGCLSAADALYDRARKTYDHAPVLKPLRPMPSDEHRARWDILLLTVWLSTGGCGGCTLLPVPPPVAPCLRSTCVVQAVRP
jgi:hypothetical protein